MGLFLCCLSRPPLARGEDSGVFPDMALLEFLGSWETDAGEWIDPGFLEDAVMGEAKGPEVGEKAQRASRETLEAGQRTAEEGPEARDGNGNDD